MKKYLLFIFTLFITLLTAVTCIAIVLVTLNKIRIFGTDGFWSGADFLPAFWLLFPVLISGLGLFFLKRKILSLIWIGIYVLFFISFGDYSFKSFLPLKKESREGITLKVGALNVQYYTHGLKTVIDSIKKMNTDVMLISENVLTEEQQKQLPELLKGYYIFQGHPNSTAIISRYPLNNSKEIELPSLEASLSGDNDMDTMKTSIHRSFVYSTININGKIINIISIRFIAGRPKNKTIKEQIRWGKYLANTQQAEAISFISFLKTLHGPIIFGGDLNAPPGSNTMEPINSIAEDAYLANHIIGTPTFRTQFPTLRLDYLFGMNGAKPLNSEIVKMEVSDHFPIISNFFIEHATQRVSN